ncbi:CIC_HP2_G0042080.mRNA.1.CDS.1 [Saccharomyces cerevisiae]|nr:CIC_HP2_G0042080.mRNA.1.CDS.1 [Saccharomyces cerevisiae]CAI6636238.1 CIC_HP2_G0042080.mRNA.1.CDS.1 [Saccharomyces cerevisiae]CAI6648426.1 CIC_HP1_G0043440.mRNA.1.CDS.1 [Saccharomyces cerevisiae]
MQKLLFVFSVLLTVVLATAPFQVQCPSSPLIREAKHELCPEETLYLKKKKIKTKNKLIQFLKSLTEAKFSSKFYKRVLKDPPKIGIAISGGGYRSMLVGTGFISQMNDYGLFEYSDYIAGLSGGSWILMDLVVQNFEVKSLLQEWDLEEDLLLGIPEFDISEEEIVTNAKKEYNDNDLKMKKRQGGSLITSSSNFYEQIEEIMNSIEEIPEDYMITKRNLNPLARLKKIFFPNNTFTGTDAKIETFKKVLDFYKSLHLKIKPKKMEGFQISFTDYWGKAIVQRLKKNFDDDPNHSFSFSKLVNSSKKFKECSVPIPIFVANCKNGLLSNVIFEFTPFEFGSWENILRLFVKLPYLGSKIVSGKAEKCINNFDDLGFITATSSSIFNNVLIFIWNLASQSSREAMKALNMVMEIFGLGKEEIFSISKDSSRLETDYAVYQPNPFYLYPEKDNVLTNKNHLYLVDGGEDGENIPLRTLVIPERELDVIFVLDSSSDIDNYPNGSKLKRIFEKLDEENVHYQFPNNVKTFTHPIVIGCNATKRTGHDSFLPIIIYHANANHGNASNTSTFKITYNQSEVSSMLLTGRGVFSNDYDLYYKNCLGCILTKRTMDRLPRKKKFSPFCLQCFKDYCYS